MKLRPILLNTNITYDGNIRFIVGSSKADGSREVYFENEVEARHNKEYRGLIEANVNGDIKFQMMLLGRQGYHKH